MDVQSYTEKCVRCENVRKDAQDVSKISSETQMTEDSMRTSKTKHLTEMLLRDGRNVVVLCTVCVYKMCSTATVRRALHAVSMDSHKHLTTSNFLYAEEGRLQNEAASMSLFRAIATHFMTKKWKKCATQPYPLLSVLSCCLSHLSLPISSLFVPNSACVSPNVTMFPYQLRVWRSLGSV